MSALQCLKKSLQIGWNKSGNNAALLDEHPWQASRGSHNAVSCITEDTTFFMSCDTRHFGKKLAEP